MDGPDPTAALGTRSALRPAGLVLCSEVRLYREALARALAGVTGVLAVTLEHT